MENKVIVLDDVSPFPVATLEPLQKYQSCLVLLFCTTNNEEYIISTVKNIKHILPSANIIGVSADEAIAATKIYSHSEIIISAIGFEKTTVKTAYATSKKSSLEIGKKIAKEIYMDNTMAIIAFADAASVNGEEFLDGMASVVKNTVVAGGMASTPSFSDTFVVFEEKIIKNGVVAVSLNSNALHVKPEYAFGWRPIGQEMIVTSADKNRVESIDSKSPLVILSKYLGRKVMESFPGLGVAFPLMIKREGMLVARGIIGLDGETLIVSGNVKTGDRVYMGYGSQTEVLEQNNVAKQIYENFKKPEAVFLFSCDGRKLFLPRQVVEYEVKHLGQFENVSGFFTLGEFFTKESPTHLNFSLTALAMSEKDDTDIEYKYKRTAMPKTELSSTVSEGLFHFIDVRADELDYLAYHDGLTNLPNRSLLFDRMEHALANAKRYGFSVGVLFVNLDRFKLINDTLGHFTGDEILKTISSRIAATLRSNETLARVGGDEFVVLLENLVDEQQAAQIASRIIETVYKPINAAGRHLRITSSIGIAIYPTDGIDHRELIKNADAAMHKAKVDDRSSFTFYRKELTSEVEKKLELQNALRSALERDEFTLFYQPQFGLLSNKLIGAEALIRWNHPQKGLIMPDMFIPEAEECGLICDIGRLVTNIACKDMKKWIDNGFKLPKVSINVGAEEFTKEDLPKRLHAELNKRNLTPNMLEIEITETGVMKDEEAVIKELHKIDAMGISIAMDDFGTGHSSLGYIHKLPIDVIKIDRSFITDVTANSSKAIIRAVHAISKELGISVLAEGIETQKQLDFLINEGCEYGQGYIFGKAIPPLEFIKRFKDGF